MKHLSTILRFGSNPLFKILSIHLSLPGEKALKKDEFLAIFKEAKNIKDSGVYEDFIECLKLYDKQSDGTMLAAELQHILVSLGE